MLKSSVTVMQDTLALARNKMFTIIGFVQAKEVKINYTVLYVKVTDLLKIRNNEETFEIFFVDKAKQFVDKVVEVTCLVDVIGHIKISKESTEKKIIIKLEGKHVYCYKNVAHIYEESTPMYVPPSVIDRNNLAY